MKLTTIIFTALLGLAAAAPKDEDKKKHNNNNNQNLTPDQQTCNNLRRFNKAVSIVNNRTRIDEIAAKNPSRAAMIRDDAMRAGPANEAINKNSTLVKYCNSYNANEMTRKQCRSLRKVERLQKDLKNSTAVDAEAKRKNKSKDEVKRFWQGEIDGAKSLQSNKTLGDVCKKMKEEKNKNGKQKSAATHVQVVGTSAFVVGLASLMVSLVL